MLTRWLANVYKKTLGWDARPYWAAGQLMGMASALGVAWCAKLRIKAYNDQRYRTKSQLDESVAKLIWG